MEPVKILERPEKLQWEYDEEADVLYLSVGTPRPAIGVDIGDGVVLRYDEGQREIVGVTLLGVRSGLLRALTANDGLNQEATADM